MVVKRSVYGTCTPDNRNDKTIRFMAFPKPKTSLGKCVCWIQSYPPPVRENQLSKEKNWTLKQYGYTHKSRM
jgi:hypothetical protein